MLKSQWRLPATRRYRGCAARPTARSFSWAGSGLRNLQRAAAPRLIGVPQCGMHRLESHTRDRF